MQQNNNNNSISKFGVRGSGAPNPPLIPRPGPPAPPAPTTVRATTSPAPTTARRTTSPAPTTVRATTSPFPTTARRTTSPAPTTVRATTSPAPTTVRATTSPFPTTARRTTSPAPTTARRTTSPAPTTVVSRTSPAPTTVVSRTSPAPTTQKIIEIPIPTIQQTFPPSTGNTGNTTDISLDVTIPTPSNTPWPMYTQDNNLFDNNTPQQTVMTEGTMYDGTTTSTGQPVEITDGLIYSTPKNIPSIILDIIANPPPSLPPPPTLPSTSFNYKFINITETPSPQLNTLSSPKTSVTVKLLSGDGKKYYYFFPGSITEKNINNSGTPTVAKLTGNGIPYEISLLSAEKTGRYLTIYNNSYKDTNNIIPLMLFINGYGNLLPTPGGALIKPKDANAVRYGLTQRGNTLPLEPGGTFNFVVSTIDGPYGPQICVGAAE